MIDFDVFGFGRFDAHMDRAKRRRSVSGGVEAVVEPAPDEAQIAVDGGLGGVEELGCFFGSEAEEETQLDHAAFLGVDFFEFFEDAIEVDHFGVAGVDPGELFMEGDGNSAITFLTAFGAGVVDEDAAHEAGGEGIEVFAVFEFEGALANEFEEELVDDGGGLEHALGALAAEEGAGDDAELGVDHFEQGFDRRGFAFTPLVQKHSDLTWVRQGCSPLEGARTVYTEREIWSRCHFWSSEVLCRKQMFAGKVAGGGGR
jgi:hypothetical protein